LNNSGCRRRGSQEKEKQETHHDKRRYNPTLTTPQPAIMAVMGIALSVCNIPNTVEVMAAIERKGHRGSSAVANGEQLLGAKLFKLANIGQFFPTLRAVQIVQKPPKRYTVIDLQGLVALCGFSQLADSQHVMRRRISTLFTRSTKR
jgi:hypothetical protein